MIKRLVFSFVVALVLFMFFLSVSCNPAAKIQRLDKQAVERVNAKASLQDSVWREYIKTHPQDISRKIIISDPKTIYTPVEKLVKDTTGLQRKVDSLLKISDTTKDCATAAINGFDLGYEQAEKYYLSHPVKTICPPDTTVTVFMRTELDNANQQIHQNEKYSANLIGQITVKDAQIKKQTSRADKILVCAIGLGLLSLILIVFIIYKTIRGGVISLFKSK